MAFGNLTVDFRQLSKIPVRDRVTLAQSPQASSIFGNLSPTEIAALFPDYYKKFIPAATGRGGATGPSMASGMTGAGYTGSGGGTAPSTGGGATPAPTSPTTPSMVQEILDSAGPMPSNSNAFKGSFSQKSSYLTKRLMNDLGLTKEQAAGFVGNLAHESAGLQVDIEEFAANVHGTKGYGLAQWTDNPPGKGRRTNLINFAKERNIPVNDFETQYQFLIHELNGAESKALAKIKSAKTIEEAAAAGVFFERPAGFKAGMWKSNDLIGSARQAHGWDSRFSYAKKSLKAYEDAVLSTQNTAEGLPGTEPIDQAVPADETGIIPLEQGGTATVAPQQMTFDPAIFTQLDPRIQEYYNTATDAEKKQLEYALMKTGVAKVNEISERHPKATAEVLTNTIDKNLQQTEDIDADRIIADIASGKMPLNKAVLNKALTIKGMDEQEDRDDIAEFLRNGGVNINPAKVPWCAAFVNSTLEQTGIKGTGSLVATSFGNWGVDVSPDEVMAGDILVEMRGKKINETGGHVGFATGAMRKNPKTGQIEYEMYGGNQGADDRGPGSRYANTKWVDANKLTFRRAPEVQLDIQKRKQKEIEDDASTIVETTPMRPLPSAEPTTQISSVNPETGSDVDTISFKKPASMPGTEAITQTQPVIQQNQSATQTQPVIQQNQSATQAQPAPQETTVQPLQQANTNMALGGTRTTDVEPNMVNEKYTITQTDPKTGETKPVANFNKDEEVNIKDGQMDVESAYKKKAQETLQKTDTGAQQENQYKMRQSTERSNDELSRQVKDGIVPRSPSFERSVYHSRFGDGHFNRGAKSQYS
jgi:uncharacterized protein (TIGR02594 family)